MFFFGNGIQEDDVFEDMWRSFRVPDTHLRAITLFKLDRELERATNELDQLTRSPFHGHIPSQAPFRHYYDAVEDIMGALFHTGQTSAELHDENSPAQLEVFGQMTDAARTLVENMRSTTYTDFSRPQRSRRFPRNSADVSNLMAYVRETNAWIAQFTGHPRIEELRANASNMKMWFQS